RHTRSKRDWSSDVCSSDLHEGLAGDVRPQMYQPYLQAPWNSMALAVRTTADPAQVVNTVRQTVWSLDSEQPVYDISTMEQRLSEIGRASCRERVATTVGDG